MIEYVLIVLFILVFIVVCLDFISGVRWRSEWRKHVISRITFELTGSELNGLDMDIRQKPKPDTMARRLDADRNRSDWEEYG